MTTLDDINDQNAASMVNPKSSDFSVHQFLVEVVLQKCSIAGYLYTRMSGVKL